MGGVEDNFNLNFEMKKDSNYFSKMQAKHIYRE